MRKNGRLFITAKDVILIELEFAPKAMIVYFCDNDPHHPSCVPSKHHRKDHCRYSHKHDHRKKKHYLHIEFEVEGIREIYWEVEF